MIDYKVLAENYRGVNAKGAPSYAKDDLAQFVEQRFYAMSYAKQAWREVIQGTQDLYYCNDWEWIVKGEGFDRPVRFPTLRDLTKSLVDTFMKSPPDIILKPKNFNDPEAVDLIAGKKAYIDSRRNSIHEKTVRRQVIEDMFFFGKGVREVNYYDIERMLDGETVTLFDDVATTRIDPRHFFIDETATKMHDKLRQTGARDTITRRIIPYSTFLAEFKNREGYRNVEGVVAENYFTTYGLDYIVTNSKEVLEKTPVWVVKLYEYKNQESNIYACVANGVTIYESTLTKATGSNRINIVDYNFEPRNDSVWGNNLAQLVAPHIYLKDTIFNLDKMNLQFTLQPLVAISGDFGYNPATHLLQPNAVWEAGSNMNGKIQDNIQTLVTGNPDSKAQEMLQYLNGEISTTTQSDMRTLEYYPDKTATEVLADNQQKNSHNETVENIAEIESEAVLFEIFIDIMKTFLVEKNEYGEKRKVNVQDYMVNKKDGPTPEFVKKSGHEDAFELSEAMINVDAEVEVLDKRSELAQNIEKMGRMMQAIPIIGNFGKIFPDVLQGLDGTGIMRQLIEAVGMDMEKSFKDLVNVYDEFEATKEEILLGHDVGVPPDESRKDSLARLKYFGAFQDDYGDKMTALQKKALKFQIDAILDNILRNHLDGSRAKDAQAQAQQQGQAPGMAPAQAQQVQNQKSQQIAQPDPALLNIKGNNLADQLH